MYSRINHFLATGSCLVLFFMNFVFAQDNVRGVEMPLVSAYRTETRPGEKNLNFNIVNMTIRNPEKFPVWVLIPAFAEDKLPENGILNARKPWTKSCISGLTYVDNETGREEGKVRRLVKVHFIGERQGFYAFHLPPFARMDFNGYVLHSLKEVSSFQVVVASELRINGNLPIDQYLIYESMASKEVTIRQSGITYLNVDWEEEDLVTEGSRTEINFIKIEKLKALEIPFKAN
ncbi:MAG: hypothetical protein K1X92_17400 [Bacteroidia bacterium]|nr:hypothetical protein [Bacteroidia bacterium]